MQLTNVSTAACITSKKCREAISDPTYGRYLLDLERNFDQCGFYSWMEDNGKISNVFIAVYLLAIYAGQHRMKQRPPLRLQGVLLAWNAALALFSIFEVWRTMPALLYQLRHVGFHESICGVGSLEYFQAVSVHAFLFNLSKVLELVDTAFLVLRKAPLRFLHWFHHTTVCIGVWSFTAHMSPVGNYCMTMNYFVHSFMYSYYALKALRVPLPRAVSMAITLMQILQMVLGAGFMLYVYRMRNRPEVGCCVADEEIKYSLALYAAYFVLFLNFFFRTYFRGKAVATDLPKKLE